MARKPQVTRTMKSTAVTVLCLDTETAEVSNVTVTVPRVYKDEKSLKRVVWPKIETESFKPTKIVDVEISSDLYTMDEDMFMELATKVER